MYRCDVTYNGLCFTRSSNQFIRVIHDNITKEPLTFYQRCFQSGYYDYRFIVSGIVVYRTRK